VSQTVFLPKILFSENLLSCVKCDVVQSAVYNKMLKETFCSTQNIGWDLSRAYYRSDEIPLNWYWRWNMSCLLRLSTLLKSDFKALFSSSNRLRAFSDAIVLLAGRCHVLHKNANCPHALRCYAGRSLMLGAG